MYSPLSDNRIIQIDWLRAFAVSVVICFHMYPSFLKGGFLGVDIFFVISGFVVTENLKKTEGTAHEKICRFYGRRIKRLAPNVIFTVITTCAVFVSLSDAAKEALITTYSTPGAYGTVGLANVYYAFRERKYFDSDKVLSLDPFMHLWSLGVEEQFYIVYPFMFFLLERHTFLILMGFCICLSFMVSLHASQSFAFFLLLSRFWQLGIGCLCAFLPSELILLRQTHRAFLCLLLFLMCCFEKNGEGVPVPVSVMPCWVAALLICSYKTSATKNTEANSILGTVFDLPAYVGRLSYAMYLTHWPTLCAARIAFSENKITELACVPLILIISIAMHHGIENVVRFRMKHRWMPGLLVSVSVILAVSLYNVSFVRSEVHRLHTPAQSNDVQHAVYIPEPPAPVLPIQGDTDAVSQTSPHVANGSIPTHASAASADGTIPADASGSNTHVTTKKTTPRDQTPSSRHENQGDAHTKLKEACGCRLQRSTRGFNTPEIDEHSNEVCMRDVSSSNLQSKLQVEDFQLDWKSNALFNFFQLEYKIPSNCASCFGKGNGDLCLVAGNLCSKKASNGHGTVYVLGDSKAVGIALLVSDIIRNTGWGLAWYAGPNCGVYVGFECGKRNYNVFLKNIKERFSVGDIVIVTGIRETVAKEETRSLYEPFVDVVTAKNGTFIILGDNPLYPGANPLMHSGCDRDSCDVRFAPEETFISDLHEWANARQHVKYYDTSESVWCKPTGCMTNVPGTNRPVTWDPTHLTREALLYLRPFLCATLHPYLHPQTSA